MKNILSKTLLCGVLGASFLISLSIGCQKAPNRPAPLAVDPNVKPSVKMAVCTETIVAELTKLSEARVAIDNRLKLVSEPVTEADKTELKEMVVKYNQSAKDMIKAIAELRVGDASADGCNIHEANDDKKPLKNNLSIGKINQARSAIGQKVKKKIGVDNIITEEDAAELAGTLRQGQELKIGAELATTLSNKDNSGDVVTNGTIKKGAEAKTALADTKATACALGISNGVVVSANAVLKILALEDVKLDEKTKRNVMKINVEVREGNKSLLLMDLSCNIAAGKEGEAAKEVRTALRDLVSQVEALADSAGEAAVISADSSATVSADATIAADDDEASDLAAKKKAAADEGIKLLDEAEAAAKN